MMLPCTKRSAQRRAQMEIVGLVVIVILITLGLLFLTIFKLKGNDSSRKVFVAQGYAFSALDALLKTTAHPDEGCAGETVTLKDQPRMGADILEDCALFFSQYCISGCDKKKDTERTVHAEAYSDYRCRGKHSCAFFKEKSSALLEKTLGLWGRKYEFRALLHTDAPKPEMLIYLHRGECPVEREGSGIFPLQTEAGEVTSELWVC